MLRVRRRIIGMTFEGLEARRLKLEDRVLTGDRYIKEKIT